MAESISTDRRSTRGKRRWLQFSLGTLFALVAVCAGLFASIWWRIELYRRQWLREQPAIERIIALGGKVKFNTMGPEWLRKLAGSDRAKFFDTVIEARVPNGSPEAPDIAPIAALTNVRVLSLANCRLTDDSLVDLESLQQLSELKLNGNPLTDRALRHLGGLEKLQLLDLNATHISGEGLAQLERLTCLQYLVIAFTGPADDSGSRNLAPVAARSLVMLKHLQTLVLRGVDLSDDDLRYVGTLNELDHFDADSALITDRGICELRRLRNMRSLVLRNTQMTDHALACLQGLKSLKRINASGTKISDGALVYIASFPNLEIFEAANTDITREALAKFKVDHPGKPVIFATNTHKREGRSRTSYHSGNR